MESRTEKVSFCFVVMEIGKLNSIERRRSDGVFDEIIGPALRELGYEVRRADHDKRPGVVTDQIIEALIDAELVVADLSGLNPNVMYELGLRHASGKAVIQMMEHGGQLPFDVSPVNTVFFSADLAGRKEAIRNLQATAESVIKQPTDGNPVRRTFELRKLADSHEPQSQLLARMLSDLQREVSELSRQRANMGQLATVHTSVDPSDIVAVAPENSEVLDVLSDSATGKISIVLRSKEPGSNTVVAQLRSYAEMPISEYLQRAQRVMERAVATGGGETSKSAAKKHKRPAGGTEP